MSIEIDAGNPVLRGLVEQLKDLREDKRKLDVAIGETERLILQQVPSKDEGNVSTDVGDMKLTVTFKLNRKIDGEKWPEVSKKIPPALQPVRFKPEVDTKGIRYLMNNEPELYAVLADALTVKPAKPYVKLEDRDV